MPSRRDIAGLHLAFGVLAALFAIGILVVPPSAEAATADEPQCMIEFWECQPEPPECAIPEHWECGDTPEAVEGRYILVFHDWVGQDPEEIAREHIDQYGGTLGFVYRYAFKGYSASGWTDTDVEAIRLDPRVDYVETDLEGCFIPEGCEPPEEGCAIPEGCEPPEEGCAVPEGCAPPDNASSEIGSAPNGVAATVPVAARKVEQAISKKKGKRCRRGHHDKRVKKRCGRGAGGAQD